MDRMLTRAIKEGKGFTVSWLLISLYCFFAFILGAKNENHFGGIISL